MSRPTWSRLPHTPEVVAALCERLEAMEDFFFAAASRLDGTPGSKWAMTAPLTHE